MAVPNSQFTAQPKPSLYSARLVTRCFCFGIIAMRLALNLCDSINILLGANQISNSQPQIYATMPQFHANGLTAFQKFAANAA